MNSGAKPFFTASVIASTLVVTLDSPGAAIPSLVFPALAAPILEVMIMITFLKST